MIVTTIYNDKIQSIVLPEKRMVSLRFFAMLVMKKRVSAI